MSCTVLSALALSSSGLANILVLLRLDVHILDYFKKRNLHATAASFKHECKVSDRPCGEGSCAQQFCGPFLCKFLLLPPPGLQQLRPQLDFCLSGGQFSGTFTYHGQTPPFQSVHPRTARCVSLSHMLTTHLRKDDSDFRHTCRPRKLRCPFVSSSFSSRCSSSNTRCCSNSWYDTACIEPVPTDLLLGDACMTLPVLDTSYCSILQPFLFYQ